MKWHESYSIDVRRIDDHHKRLVRLIDRLQRSLDEGSLVREVGPALKELVAYTRYHFAEEETLMHQLRFSEREEHARLHKELVGEVAGIIGKIRRGESVTAVELIEFLKRWLSEHILQEDAKIGHAYRLQVERARASSIRPDELPRDPEVTERAAALQARLARTMVMVDEGLVEVEDLEEKRRALLDELVESIADGATSAATTALHALDQLVERELLPIEVHQEVGTRIAAKLDLDAAMEVFAEIEDKLAFLKPLADKELIDRDLYDQKKKALLDEI